MSQPLIQILTIAAATLVSEDLTCLASGNLAAAGELPWAVAITGCIVGIYLGDLGLYAIGRMLHRPVFAAARRLVDPAATERFTDLLRRRAGWTLSLSRLLPGSRLPMYIAAGVARVPLKTFSLFTGLAVLIWTPPLVLVGGWLGQAIHVRIQRIIGIGSIAWLITVVSACIALRLAMLAATPIGRGRIMAAVSRLWRWEFWPTWLFYLPTAIWIFILSIRHRSFSIITAANPGISHGGFVGESKSQILAQLNCSQVLPFALIAPGPLPHRLERLKQWMRQAAQCYPIILKPDVGQRGASVRLIQSEADAADYLDRVELPVISQQFHAGPLEAGIFYYRMPGEFRGRIYSITCKRFPELIGDGHSNLRQLIWSHPRYRMQARTFLARHAAQVDRILTVGEMFRLVTAGNHCQGALFLDGSELITTQLEHAIDSIAQSMRGFFFGRFDVRFSDIDAFKAGRDLAIVELNGITSEATHIYDPSFSLLRAQASLLRQWTLLFRIAAANRRRGERGSTMIQLFREVVRYYRSPRATALGD